MNKKKTVGITIGLCILFFSIFRFKLAIEEDIKNKTNNENRYIKAKTKEENVVIVDSFDKYSLEVLNHVGEFSVQNLSKGVIDRIDGNSWREGAPIDLDELAYLEVTYWGFDDNPHLGELIVNKEIADEVIDIFQDIYEARFPIEKMRLIDEYDANDDLSMEDNNTSAFCYRIVTGGDTLSKHSYGIAIDINPIQNPYVAKNGISPKKGREYLNRDNIRKGMIVKDDVVYKAFKSRGWIWGGEWNSLKDYQHFQKDIILKEN